GAAEPEPGQQMAAVRGVQQHGPRGGAVRRPDDLRRGHEDVARAHLPEHGRELEHRRTQLHAQRLLAHADLVLLMKMGGPEKPPHTPQRSGAPRPSRGAPHPGSLSDSADRAISSVQDQKYRKYPSCPAWAWLAAPAD